MKTTVRLSLLAMIIAGTSLISSCSKNDNPVDPTVDPPVEEGSNPSLADSFFDKVTFKGAFGTTNWTNGWANFDPMSTVYGAATETLSGEITADRTLNASTVYKLVGFVYVRDGVTLTIPAGTVIRGDKVSKATLVVTRGGKINAQGTAEKPIVFTSNQAVGSRAPGDWGGIIILGRSTNNIPGGQGLIEGGLTTPYGNHGGTIADDNSGILKYVRVEFPGIAYTTNNEINGITFGSVGSKTQVDYIQVAYSGDDAYEWFGGNVNAKHLLATHTVDDMFDFDNGFTGKLQYIVGQRNPQLADQAGQSNGIEADNSESVYESSPRTRPVISNMTLIGPGNQNVDTRHEYANMWRRGARMVLANSLFIHARYGIAVRDKATGDALQDGSSVIKNNIYQAFVTEKEVVADGNVPSFATAELLRTYLTSQRNTFITATAAAELLTAPYSLTAPNFTLKSGSAAATGASF